jgi:topoisomerase IA-like protein
MFLRKTSPPSAGKQGEGVKLSIRTGPYGPYTNEQLDGRGVLTPPDMRSYNPMEKNKKRGAGFKRVL